MTASHDIERWKKESAELIQSLATPWIMDMAELLAHTIEMGNKVLIAGNGGSAADAQHFAAELVGRYKLERRSYPSIALTTDTSILTAIGNDYGYDEVFSRQVEGLGQKGDVLVLISTSGNSPNLLRASQQAKRQGLKTISLLGKTGGKLKDVTDHVYIIPADNTPRIQEAHGFIIHALCELAENKIR